MMLGKYNNILHLFLFICTVLAISYAPLSQAATCSPPSLRTAQDDGDSTTGEDGVHYHNHNHIHVQLALDESLTKGGDPPTIDVDPNVTIGKASPQCTIVSSTNDNTNNRERVVVPKLTSKKDQGDYDEEEDKRGQEKVIKFQVGETGLSKGNKWRNLEYNDYEYKDERHNDIDDNNNADNDDENEDHRPRNRNEYDYDDEDDDDDEKNNGGQIKDDVDVVIDVYDTDVKAKHRDKTRNDRLSHKYDTTTIHSKVSRHEEDVDNNDHTLVSNTLGDNATKRKKTRGGNILNGHGHDIDDETHPNDNRDNADGRLSVGGKYANEKRRPILNNRNRKYGNNHNYLDEQEDYDIQDPLNTKRAKGNKQGDTVYDDYDYETLGRDDTGKHKNTLQNRNRNRIWKSTTRTTIAEDLGEGADRQYPNNPKGKQPGTTGPRGIRFRGEDIDEDVNDDLPDDVAEVRDQNAGHNPDGDDLLDDAEDLEGHRGTPKDDIDEVEYNDDALGDGDTRDAYQTDDYPAEHNGPITDHSPHTDTLDGYHGSGRDHRPPNRVQQPEDERLAYDNRAHNNEGGNLHPKPHSGVYDDGVHHGPIDDGQVGGAPRRPLRPRIQVDQYIESAKPAVPINKPKVTMWPCITVKNRVVPFYQPIPCQIPATKCSRVILS